MSATAIPIKVSRKEALELIPINKKGNVIGHIPVIDSEAGPRIMALADAKQMGLYNVIRGLIDKGKLQRLNPNGTVKITNSRTATYFDWDQFNQLREF